MYTRATALLLGMSLLALSSCGRDAGPPSTPPAPVATVSELHVPAAEEGVILGAAGIRIDPDRGTVDVEPVRVNQAIGDAYLVGLNELDPFCNCFEVRSIQRTPLSSGDIRLTLDLSFRHPFALAARPDLFGWDLKAIFASDRSATVFAGAGVVVDDRTVANRAGYTTEWSDQIAAAVPGLSTTAFPYIVLGEDPVPLEPFDFRNPGGWNVFPSGGTNTGELQLDLTPGTILSAHFFFTVGYQVSATRTTRQAPLYSPPRGNTRAAWRVNATVVSDTLTPSTGSTADVEVAIWDWQHGQGLGSDVASIRVYAPELMASPLTLTPSGGTGRGDSPLTATAVLINELGTVPAGSTLVLIEVVDELHENNPGGGGGNSGVTRIEDDLVTPSPLDDFRTFQAVRLQVGSGTPNNPPTAVLVTTPPMGPPGALTIPAGTTVNFDGSASSDPDAPLSPQGDLVLFEYDYEWDGVLVNFAPDESHPTPAPTSHLYGIQQSTKMGFGVTDGLGLRTIFTVDVTVTPSNFTLVLDSIIDLVSVPDNRPEWGATLTEEGNGTIAITYIAEHLWFPSPTNAQRASPGYRSLWQGGGWTAGTDQVGGVPSTGGGSDPNTVPQWGWYLKASPNWGVPGTAYLQTANNPVNHTINTSWRSLVLGYLAPDANGPPADCAGMVTAVSYCADFAISRTTGAMYSFGDALDFSYTPGIVVRQGGPNNWCLPTTGWNGAVPTATVDSRPSHISRWRSTASDAAGGIHLAYRSVDKGRVSYARSPSGAVTGFTTADLALGAAGEFADPTLEYDPTSGLYVVSVQAVSGGGSQLVYWRSTDGGVSFAPMAVAGAPMATEPTDLSVSARSIAGHSVIAIGYFSGGQQWLRWSANNGGAWTDVALTPGPTDYSGEILIDRDSPDFFCVFSRFDAGGRSNVMARHGTFGTP